MLEPHSRRLLLDALGPPPGYRFDCAVGTTFTLDLLALLTAPLAFSLIDITEHEGGRPVVDPLALLEAARRHAQRIALFTDAGHVAVPRAGQPLFALLEQTVVPVTAPRWGGVFHPKVWLVRYLAAGEPTKLRLLCSSRNLTFDRSWDTLLVLDGEVEGETAAGNEPLARFVEALPGLAVTQPVAPRIRDDVATLASDARRAAFVAPEELELVAFHPMGLEGSTVDPFDGRVDRLLAIAPFVGGGRLRALAGRRRTNILVSRSDELASVPPEDLSGYEEILVLSETAVPEPIEGERDPSVEPFPSGLHAKVYAADAGWKARLWTGSANATDVAFGTNVEFMVELLGPKRLCGVDALLAPGSQASPGLRDLLDPYLHAEPPQPDPELERRRYLIERARTAITQAGIRGRIVPSEVGGEYELRLESSAGALEVPEEVTARCRPITLGEGFSGVLRPEGDPHLRFTGLDIRQVSAFIAVSLSLEETAGELERFTLAVPLDGAPADRPAAVLSALLATRRDLVRFLLLLLAADESTISERLNDLRRLLSQPGEDGGGADVGPPLLEPLLRSLAHDPARIDQVARVIEELRATTEGRERLPEHLEDVWEAIWAARQAVS